MLSISLLVFLWLNCPGQSGFKESQLSYPRVREAYQQEGEKIDRILQSQGLSATDLELYLLAFKEEKKLEVWARDKESAKFNLLHSFDICRTSGVPGPKRKQGDLQIPEGFYHISAYNPWSRFHLSMCINYPNPSDRILGVQGRLGGDICIHGACVTIGCLPLTDVKIKQLYLLCVQAKNNGQSKIPITIYPARLNPDNYRRLTETYRENEDRLNLWADLRTAYEIFQTEQRFPEITFLTNGLHSIR